MMEFLRELLLNTIEFSRELLLNTLLLVTMALWAGAAMMIVHGLLLRRRMNGSPSVFECVTKRALFLVLGAGIFTALLTTQAKTVHWDWFGTLLLLVATAPAVLTWLGPPDEHVEACNLCQIGKGSAYGHFFGYLRLMQGDHGIRNRLEKFRGRNPAGLSEGELRDFYSTALVVLAPTDGKYPSNAFNDLKGVGDKLCDLEGFKCTVGGNPRTYGAFSVHEVTSSGGEKRYVALDKVGALGTLAKLRQHGPAGLGDAECKRQMKDMLDELEEIVAGTEHLRGQLKIVRYANEGEEHVGDAIMAAIGGARN